MAKLYIIGNGFDLWHGLPTGYDRFYTFAKVMLDELENYYSFDVAHVGPWCDFENSLGCFDWLQFYEAHNHIDVASESFRPSEVCGMEEEPELDESGDSNRTMFSDAKAAAKYPFYALQKPVSKVLEENCKLFDSVGHVSEIIVVGHSLNKIDLPYFSKLAACAPNARWLVCCYEEADEVHHVEELVNCGVRCESIRTCTYADLQDEHHHGRT